MSALQPNNHSARRKQHAQSADLVQRVVVSALIAVVFGAFAAVLAAYLALAGDKDLPPTSVIGLWIMTGVMGLGAAVAVLLINRRRPYSPWVLLGLLPMAISAPWILG
jgi:4-amino-4-deoxy-L-arabinose transferase-like glycosyltransferase